MLYNDSYDDYDDLRSWILMRVVIMIRELLWNVSRAQKSQIKVTRPSGSAPLTALVEWASSPL